MCPLSRTLALATIVCGTSLHASASDDLAQASSAFLRASADSPVHWTTWGEAAFSRAKEEKKPIYLHVGAFTSELARAMREQSFSRPETADLLNEHFVNILVDRDDHPEVAAFCQAYLDVVKQTQGSPYNVWLTPELQPFEGASYLPPSDEWGKEGFPNATKRVINAWQANPDAQFNKGASSIETLSEAALGAPPPFAADKTAQLLQESAESWQATFDEANTGFGDAPKHPQPELLRFLLAADGTSREMALKTLRVLADSAIHDPLDGGFFKYAADPAWKIPSLQKQLSDQARLALAYLDANKIAPEAGFARAARSALEFALSLRDPEIGYIAAVDGTDDTVAPTYLWTFDEIKTALGDQEGAAFATAYGATAEGNLAPDDILGVDTAGKNILFRATPPGRAEAEARLADDAAKLLAIRAQRGSPPRDSAATAGTHGLLLSALSRAGSQLEEPRFTKAARELVALIRKHLLGPDGQLHARPDLANEASPRDYALVITGLLDCQAASGDAAAGELAAGLNGRLESVFADEETGRYFAYPEGAIPGVAVRIQARGPEGRDLPGATAAALIVHTANPSAADATRKHEAAAIAFDIRQSPQQARGDQLLALQTLLQEH